MKKLLFIFITLLVSGGIIFSAGITVTQPAAGVTWNKGQTKTIKWTKASNCTDNDIKINIFINNTDPSNFVQQLTCTGCTQKEWTIPNSFADGTYVIRVKTADNACFGDSGAFTIGTGTTITFQPMQVQAFLIAKPDLKVTITPTPVSPGAGQQTVVAFKTTNIGEGKSKDTVMKAFVGQTLKGAWNVGELAKGDHYTKTVEMTPDGPGYYLWTARVDENNNIGDTNRENNYAKLKQIIKGPDLVVAFDGGIRSIITTTATVKGYVRNNGQYKSTPCKLKIYMEKKGVKKYNVPALDPGEIFEVARGEKYYIARTITVNMMIDVDGVVKEENETNNFVEENIKIVLQSPYWASHYYCSNGKDGNPLDTVW